ncbi:MAG: class I SAM-dependent methyltransferase [Flavobacteriaceae bacterium]|jgi:SAM-dependent methyltransferase|nr:class I SAM-dependent methyltransferase [Flavobacteriaceae bacterium]
MKWFETWFDTPYYHILYKNRDYKEAEHFLTKLIDFLQLPKRSKIIDLACGKGRHSIFLNKMQFDVLGLDLSEQSIKHNKLFENSTLKFRVHDMRNPILHEKADAVFNLFTSFGYFENEEDDLKVFRSVANVLKENAYFVLDYLNPNFVRKNLEETSVVQKENYVFNIRKKIEDHFIIKEIDFSDDGKDFHFVEKVKLCTPEKIDEYAKQTGFERIKIWGNYALENFDEEISPRCINLFKLKK